jgi:hypothetical protein
MIPYEVDPSLHTGKPVEPRMDDGFSPPAPGQSPAVAPLRSGDAPTASDEPLGDKSDF